MAAIRIKRGTRAQIETARAANGLATGEPYLITDVAALGLATANNAFLQFGPGIYFVNHGATAGTARPAGAVFVIWYGSVQPTNMVAPDIVIRTDEAV